MRLAVLLIAAAGWAQTPIAAPAIGKMLDASGTLRPVYGVSGNLILGPPETVWAISAACSVDLCLAKAGSRIVGPRNSVIAPPGSALFTFDGADAVLYFAAADQFSRWHNGRLTRLAWHVDGEVLALGKGEIAVRRGADVWIVRPDGAILDYLGEVSGPVLLLDGAAVLASGKDLILRRSDGDEVHFDLPGIRGVSLLGPEYVQVNTSSSSYALRTTPGREELLLLPASPAPPPLRTRRVTLP